MVPVTSVTFSFISSAKDKIKYFSLKARMALPARLLLSYELSVSKTWLPFPGATKVLPTTEGLWG